MRTRTWTSAALVILLGAGMTTPAVAQRGFGDRGMRAGIGCAEHALRLSEGLELTEQQVSQLEALRASCVERRQAHQAEALEMRSQLLAGQITADDFHAAMEARRETAQAARDSTRTRLETILTEEQLAELDRSVRTAARARMHRGFGRGQRGMRGRGGRGFRGRWQPPMGGRGMRLRIHREDF